MHMCDCAKIGMRLQTMNHQQQRDFRKMHRKIVMNDFFYIFQRQQTLGNKIEVEITKLVEENPTILRLGLHLEYNDARNRVATHLQRNLDRSKNYFCFF